MTNDKKMKHIDLQIDSHLKFLDQIEQQRWRFTQAFGIAALIGLAFGGSKSPELLQSIEGIRQIGYLLALIVSISGIITNIRIIGVYWSQWQKIRTLQKYKLQLMKTNLPSEIDQAWCLPDIIPEGAKMFKKFTVHEANCLLFSCLLSVSLVLIFGSVPLDMVVIGLTINTDFVIIILLTLIFTYICHVLGWRYYNLVYNKG